MNFRKLYSAQRLRPEVRLFLVAFIASLFFHLALIKPLSDLFRSNEIELKQKPSPIVELQTATEEKGKKRLAEKETKDEKTYSDPKKRVLSEEGLEEPEVTESKLPPKLASKNFHRSEEKMRSPLLRDTENQSFQAKKLLDENGSYLEQEPEIPEEIRKTMRGIEPEKTNQDDIQFTMNSYKWSFERYAENWAVDLRKWWRAPSDYLAGKLPKGGSVWIRVVLAKNGELAGYKVYKSAVTPEMELRVVQALIGSFERPNLPDQFPEDQLVINWRFIYPPIYGNVQMKK